MDKILERVKIKVYDQCGWEISNLQSDPESKEYDAGQFDLNGLKIISRTAKITPKKMGQFVTCWKRNEKGITVPFSENDDFDFYVINVEHEKTYGQFVFPKLILIKHGIVATAKKDGKRGFRVYPIWDVANSQQAEKTQKWQLDYFFQIEELADLKRIKELYCL